MRLILPWAFSLLAILAGVTVVAPLSMRAQDDFEEEELAPEEELERQYQTKLETPMVGEYINFAGMSPVLLQGVGLVVGLNGTGGDPAPSPQRTAMLEELKKMRVPDPNTILRSPDTALVVVQTYLPPILKPGEKLDVQILVPPSAGAKSIKGGWLMETLLYEQALVPGRQQIQGFAFAKAKGPVLAASLGAENSRNSQLELRGRVLGGATVTKERKLAIYLRNEFRTVRNSNRVAQVIGTRFHGYDKHGIKLPMAEAKTDQQIELRVHPEYKDNYPRYLQVIRHLAFREDNVGRRVRMQQLQKELAQPETADRAALQLEAIGQDGVPILKGGLKSPILECRFHAAMALAYLGESEGLPVLKEAVRDERAFRVFALAAMSTLEDAETNLILRDLMNESSAETRYGAFRALWTLDRNDPFIRGIPLKGGSTSQNSEYALHVLSTRGDPLTHVALRTRPEIVLFGADQKFQTPLYLTAGRDIMITGQAGSETVTVCRFEPGKPDQRKEVSLRVAEVILTADEMGATYPDLVQMLVEASNQRNLPTRLATDALPESGRAYNRPGSKPDERAKPTKIGREIFTPNLFPRSEGEDDIRDEPRESEQPANMASVPSKTGGEEGLDENSADMPPSQEPVELEDEGPPSQSDEEDTEEDRAKPSGRKWWNFFGGRRK